MLLFSLRKTFLLVSPLFLLPFFFAFFSSSVEAAQAPYYYYYPSQYYGWSFTDYSGEYAREWYPNYLYDDSYIPQCTTPDWEDVDISFCQKNLGSPNNICCTSGGGCPSNEGGTIPLWGWEYATGCQAKGIAGTCEWDYKYSYTNCGAYDTCDAGGRPLEPKLYAGQCQPGGCSVGGIYKTCCDPNTGRMDGNCQGGEFSGTCPGGSTTMICGVDAGTCAAVVPYPCTTNPCGDSACSILAPQKYTCNASYQCVEDPNGAYSSLSGCQAACVAPPPNKCIWNGVNYNPGDYSVRCTTSACSGTTTDCAAEVYQCNINGTWDYKNPECRPDLCGSNCGVPTPPPPPPPAQDCYQFKCLCNSGGLECFTKTLWASPDQCTGPGGWGWCKSNETGEWPVCWDGGDCGGGRCEATLRPRSECESPPEPPGSECKLINAYVDPPQVMTCAGTTFTFTSTLSYINVSLQTTGGFSGCSLKRAAGGPNCTATDNPKDSFGCWWQWDCNTNDSGGTGTYWATFVGQVPDGSRTCTKPISYSVVPRTPGACQQGQGIWRQNYENWQSGFGLGDFRYETLSPQVAFDWQEPRQPECVGSTEYSIRMGNYLTPPQGTGYYRIMLYVNDGVRMWVDKNRNEVEDSGEWIIDQYGAQGWDTRCYKGLYLEAGKWYKFKIDYTQNVDNDGLITFYYAYTGGSPELDQPCFWGPGWPQSAFRSCYPPTPPACTVDLVPAQAILESGAQQPMVASVTIQSPDTTINEVRFLSDNTSVASVDPTTDGNVDDGWGTTATAGTVTVQTTATLTAKVVASSPEYSWVESCQGTAQITVNPPGPWFQSKGGDVHGQSDLRSKIPSTATDKNFSIDLNNYPGLVSYGGSSATFGQGLISSKGWLANSGFLSAKSTFAYFYQKLDSPTVDNFSCDGACPNPPSGQTTIYYSADNVSIDGNNAWAIPANTKVVVLINGDLNISLNPNNKRITVPVGSFLAFIVKGNIKIDGGVGNKQLGYSIEPFLQGIYLADGTIDTYASDLRGLGSGFRFIGAGLFYGKTGVTLGRNLKNDPLANIKNSDTPAELFLFRPDLVINAPKELWYSKMSWLEVAP